MVRCGATLQPVVLVVLAFATVSFGEDPHSPALYELDEWTECDHLYCMVRVVLTSVDKEHSTSPAQVVHDDFRHFRRTLLDRGLCLQSVDTARYREVYRGGRYRDVKLQPFPASAWNRYDRYILERANFPPSFHPNESTELVASAVINGRLAHEHPGLVAYTEIEYCHEPNARVTHTHSVPVVLALALVLGCVVWRNVPEWRSVRAPDSRQPFLLFDVYKNFAMLATVQAHCILFGPFLLPLKNVDYLEALVTHPKIKLFGLLSPFLMLVFFTMSAMLLTVNLLRARNDSPRPTFAAIVVHRLIRLQPLNLLTVGFCAFAYHRFIGGPLGPRQLIVEQHACRSRWWMNALFISNFNMHKPCLPHSWYLSADFQLFLLIALLVLATFRWPRKTTPLMAAAIVCSFLGPFLTVLWTDFDPIVPDNLHDMRFFLLGNAFMVQLYTPFYTNMGWSVGGMLAGFVYHRYRKCASSEPAKIARRRTASIIRRLNLFIVVTFLLMVTCGPPLLAAPKYASEDGRWWLATLYTGFKLSSAAFFSAGMVRVLVTEKDFLGSALVRMSAKFYYCVYLIHIPIFRIVFSSVPTTTEVTTGMLIYMGMKVFAISYVLAILLHHTFEKPVIRFLRRVLLHRA